MKAKNFVLALVLITLAACSNKNQNSSESSPDTSPARQAPSTPAPPPQADMLRYITVLATNDIHGGIEASKDRSGKTLGGLAIFKGIVTAERQASQQNYGDAGGVLVLDAGDQYQGTLISNFNEGSLVFKAMDAIGYNAVVPGNHSYDFGPKGWLEDSVTQTSKDQNPRGVVESLAQSVHFPLLSANTFFTNSIRAADGTLIPVTNDQCKPLTADAPAIDWNATKSPAFLSPYLIKTVAGVRVALIGIDNPHTATTTTTVNVSDLCFAEALDVYKRVRMSLEGKADLFVMILHDGNIDKEKNAEKLTADLLDWNPRAVDLVIAGHTHVIHDINVGGVHAIQSGANGQRFGRVNLVWNATKNRPEPSRTKSYAGIGLYPKSCDTKVVGIDDFCSAHDGKLFYDNIEVSSATDIEGLIAAERERIAPIARKKLGSSDKTITRDRILESPLPNILTDAFRAAAVSDVSFINTGGIRDDMAAGDFTYEDLFRILPFNNHGLVVGPMSWKQLKSLLERSIKSCGSYGALMQSGLMVEFLRNCDTAVGAVDDKAYLLRVKTVAGEELLDRVKNFEVPMDKTFQVATLDFLAAGGSGYDGFKGTPLVRDMGILREVLADLLSQNPAQWTNAIDGRWKLVHP